MKNKFFEWLTKNITTIYIILIAITILAPIILTQNWTGVDFSSSGQVGDTIGGLTSPFLNFLSVTLLYLALKEQMKFNNKQVSLDKKNKDYETVLNLVDQIRTEVRELSVVVNLPNNQQKEINGLATLFEVSKLALNGNLRTEIDEFSLKPFKLSFTFLIHTIQQFLEKNSNAEISQEEKAIFYSMITKYKTPFFMLIEALHEFAHRKNPVDDIDKEFCMMFLLKNFLEKEFEKHKQEMTNNVVLEECED